MTRYMPAGHRARHVSVAPARARRESARAPAKDQLSETEALWKGGAREGKSPEPSNNAGSGNPDDPGRHLETVFASPERGGDPVTAILAWLALLPGGTDPPAAAGRLHHRLREKAQAPLSQAQARLLDLLAFVAAHRSADRRQDLRPASCRRSHNDNQDA